ncbi:MAG: hypothetical protein QM706_15225 [Nitrospira sp.]
MKHRILSWILVGIAASSSGIEKTLPSADARELDQEIYQMLSYGMTEAEVAGRAG